jgi:3-deoxy-D-manno-octulosonic-acid transferase
MVLANARLSERSARRGQRLAALLHPAGRALTHALAQTEADAQRLRAAGVPRVTVCGNLKYDLTPPPEQLAQGRRWHEKLARPVLLFANTREGEEQALLARWPAWRAQWRPALAVEPLLVIVPRHPQRFAAVAELIRASGLRLAQRSQWRDEVPSDALSADVWLGDSLGELARFYACADVALLGGSFEPLGGHNLIEAAACGCPMVLGPSTFNFAEAAVQAVQAGAAWQEPGLDAALKQAAQVLADAAQRNQAAEAATRFSAAHQGAAQRMVVAMAAQQLMAPSVE